MDSDLWPLTTLRLRTPRLELRLPSDRDLADLARLAAASVHDPHVQPFGVAWTDVPPAERRGVGTEVRAAVLQLAVSIEGLEACLPMFGLTPDGAPSE